MLKINLIHHFNIKLCGLLPRLISMSRPYYQQNVFSIKVRNSALNLLPVLRPNQNLLSETIIAFAYCKTNIHGYEKSDIFTDVLYPSSKHRFPCLHFVHADRKNTTAILYTKAFISARAFSPVCLSM